jgi:cell division protein FtsN
MTDRAIDSNKRAVMLASFLSSRMCLLHRLIDLSQCLRTSLRYSQARCAASNSPRLWTKSGHREEVDVAWKIDAVLRSTVASVLLALTPVGYYYLVHLPQRNAQFESDRALEGLRAAAQKRADQERLLFEQRAAEQRAAEQQALEERQALEKANRYQTCLSRATASYNASRLTACNRPREKIIKDRDDCVKLGFSEKVCAMAHVVREASPNCTLPRAVSLALDADVENARDRCVEEDTDGSAISATQSRTAGVGRLEPVAPAPIAPPLKARAPSPKTATVTAARVDPGAELTEPIPMAAVRPKALASASKTTAMPPAAGTPVVPHAPEAAAPDARRLVAAQRAQTQAGWIVQIGAFDIEREAERQLSSARAKARDLLDNADPFTEMVVKGDKTLYRARFAGFQQKDEAEAVCKQLKLSDIDCITIKN